MSGVIGTGISGGAGTEIDQLTASYEQGFQNEADGGSGIYGDVEDWPAITLAAHERRQEILAGLPIGDVSDKVCVDYGVGSWGFACIYPRLQHCRQAIGIDISKSAIAASVAISEQGNFPYGRNFSYLTSRGDQLNLPSGTADVLFSGESIEHVDHTDAFLDEIHRVLKPGGLFVVTTPNADAYLYRVHGEAYCIGPEHVALMGYQELMEYLAPRFEVIKAHGFNSSFYGDMDLKVKDRDFARTWAHQFLDQPDLANGLVILARRRDEYVAKRYRQWRFHHESSAIRYEGPWKPAALHRVMTGRLATGGEHSALTLNFQGTGVILHLWCHDWSGYAKVEVDGTTHPPVSLYSRLGGFKRIIVNDLKPGVHRLRISGSPDRPPQSHSNQIIFYQATSFECE